MKIKTLMICEKTTQLKQIKETSEFNELYKTRDFKFHFAHTVVPFFIFKYVQKNIKYKDLPLINEINYKFNNRNLIENLIIDFPNQKEDILNSSYSNSYKNLTKEFFEQFEDIIIASDNDESGCYNTWNEIFLTTGKNINEIFNNIYFLNTNYMEETTLNKNINLLFNDQTYKENRITLFENFKERGYIKKYFEYNYQLNSNILIKELYQNIFDNNDEELYSKFGFTKYMIYLCFMIKKEEKYFNYAKIIQKMDKQKIGSPASRPYIIQNLEKLNIIKFDEDLKILYITDKGLLFINSLNKKLNDPFLSQRISNWQDEYLIDKEKTCEKINNYIKEIFSKQKKKNRYFK